MTDLGHKAVMCPILVGRSQQLVALHQLINAAKIGRGQTVLIAGEAGIGKSRLAAAAVQAAVEQGFSLFVGHCFPPDLSSPYAPLRDLLQSQFATQPGSSRVDALDPIVQELAQLLPGILPLPLEGYEEGPRLDPEAQTQRIFAALTHYFLRHASQQPVLLLIEDLHWSDDSSLMFLHRLALRAAGQPFLLILTYRNDEGNPRLDRWLAQLDRERLAHEIVLSQLSREEVATMLHATIGAGRSSHGELLQALYDLTEGNPFFVEELLKSLFASGDIGQTKDGWISRPLVEVQIPRSVRDAVRQRVLRLSARAQHVVRLAAVLGRRFDFALLQALTQLDEPELLHVIKELIGAQLVVEAAPELFAFRHALTRQAIYSELLARERQALHREIAETIEHLHARTLDGNLDDLAYHTYAAGLWEKALVYTQRAGARAQSLFASQAAVEQFSRALTAAHRLELEPPASLYQHLGRAYATLGDFEHARAAYEAALQGAGATGDRHSEWQALLDLGLLWASRDYMRTGSCYRRALELATEVGKPGLLAHSYNRLGNWHLNTERAQEAIKYCTQALEIFEAIDDRRGIAETLDLLGGARAVSGDVVQGAIHFRQAIALFRALGDRQSLASALDSLIFCAGCYETETLVPVPMPRSAVLETADEALQVARAIGWRAGEAFTLIQLAMYLGPQGEYDRALLAAQQSVAIADEIGHRQWLTGAHCALGALYLDMLALREARQHLEQALTLAKEIGSLHWEHLIAGLLASCCVQEQDFTRAESLVAAPPAFESLLGSGPGRLRVYARAELALARGAVGLVITIVDRLIATAPNVSQQQPIPHLWHLRAQALLIQERSVQQASSEADQAEALLQDAAAAAATQGNGRLLWRIHVTLGRFYQSRRRRGDSARAFASARTIIEELGANISDESLRHTFLRRATAALPRPRPITPGQAEKQSYGGLTKRERQVAALIAQGRSNRAIAEELVLSRRTVEGYVENIMAKLGVAARTQIAAWAVEHGLDGAAS